MRQLAWLASAPKEMGLSRRDWIAKHHGPVVAAGFDVPAGPLRWLVDLWEDAGRTRVEMGPQGVELLGLGWREIAAWIEGAQEHDLAPVFRRGVMALSSAYAQVAMAAVSVECAAPFDPGKS